MKIPKRWAILVLRNDRVTVEVLPYLYSKLEDLYQALPHLRKAYGGVTLFPAECRFKLISRKARRGTSE
jgi:hypothetical protein